MLQTDAAQTAAARYVFKCRPSMVQESNEAIPPAEFRVNGEVAMFHSVALHLTPHDSGAVFGEFRRPLYPPRRPVKSQATHRSRSHFARQGHHFRPNPAPPAASLRERWWPFAPRKDSIPEF